MLLIYRHASDVIAMMRTVDREERVDVHRRPVPDFRFLTNHGNALLLIARDPRIRIRDIATLLDIPERAAQRTVIDLVKSGYIDSERQGRRNVYRVKVDRPFNLPFQRDIDINALLGMLAHIGDPGVSTPD
jgi:DNA-binding transcriptional ArsR family regulator